MKRMRMDRTFSPGCVRGMLPGVLPGVAPGWYRASPLALADSRLEFAAKNTLPRGKGS
jgi:hypothetical protein